MPRVINKQERLREIAEATLEVSRKGGAASVTIRAVADQLERSTSFITNFVPTRMQLMLNALEYGRLYWSDDRTQLLEGATGADRLAQLAQWLCSINEYDAELRDIWFDVRASTGERTEVLAQMNDSLYTEFQESAQRAELDFPEQTADILYLFGRGLYTMNRENPARWDDERAAGALALLLSRFLDAPEAADG